MELTWLSGGKAALNKVDDDYLSFYDLESQSNRDTLKELITEHITKQYGDGDIYQCFSVYGPDEDEESFENGDYDERYEPVGVRIEGKMDDMTVSFHCEEFQDMKEHVSLDAAVSYGVETIAACAQCYANDLEGDEVADAVKEAGEKALMPDLGTALESMEAGQAKGLEA